MFTRIAVTYRGAVPGSHAFGLAEWRDMLRLAWEQVGLLWHTRFRPKHFTRAGAREYGYPSTSRNVRYEFIKLRKMGLQPAKHNLGLTRPLVYSGESETASRVPDVRATPGGVKILIKAKGISFWQTRIGAITEAEAREMAQLHDRIMRTQIGDLQTTETQTF